MHNQLKPGDPGVQAGDFYLEVDSDDSNRVYLDIGGLTVLVNATREGVVVDVLPQQPPAEEGDEILATLACPYPDMAGGAQ